MNKQELIRKLQDVEWEDFEVKEAQSEVPRNCWETISAFANTNGGWLIFGVAKRGKEYEIHGVKNAEKIENDFLTVLRGEKFNKKLKTIPKKYTIDNRIVLGFYVSPASPKDKPIYFNSVSNTFIRTGSGDQRATPAEIDAMYRSASFEEKDQELTRYTIKDLDNKSISGYREYFSLVNKGHSFNKLSRLKFLEKLRVVINGKVTYGGLLMFGKEDIIQRSFPNFQIDYLEVPGISYEDAPTRYTYRLTCEYNLYNSFFDVYNRLTKNIDVPFKVVGMFREDDPPQLQAIREALVNLLIHSDYFSKAVPRIRVFTDRIEFFNPGTLPKDIDSILRESFSLPRNPIVAKIFRFIRLAETIGSGFNKMINGWQSYYKTKPVISGDINFYKITFPFGAKSRDTVKDTVRDTVKLLSDNEILIIKSITENPKITANELSVTIKINLRNTKKYLAKLKGKGIIKRIGSDKTGRWEVVGK